MFLNKLINIARSPTNVNQLSNLFQRCLISSTPVINNKLTVNKPLEFVNLKDGKDPVQNVNNKIQNNEAGRLFAVVQICGKQFKITQGDVIMLEGFWEPTNGDELKLEKVLLCGSQDFTLVGRPVLQKGLVDIQATVIEKSLSHTRTHFKYKKRKQYRRFNFQRSPTTVLRINSIEINNSVDQNETPQTSDNVFF
ncbi:large ribosomal subunit protein bL21 [Chironomus tepperi]|uniref:large ribosomal subunit protein bL21 n=1 Tax=Chironomus tepperi TaxID=113505 RepID=UPI00391F6F93